MDDDDTLRASSVDQQLVGHIARIADVIVKPHHEEDIFVITWGRGVNNKHILRVQVGFNWLLSQHGFYTTCLQ